MRFMADVSIVGAAGYTGQETLDRVLGHPHLRLVAVGSDSLAGQPAAALDPRLVDADVPAFVTNEAALAHEADVTVICLSHERAAAIEVPRDGVVVDLSGAHRLRDASSYEAWYGFAHPRPEGLADWVYGLPELVAESGRLIANPGCYATATLLALGPLKDVIEPGSVVVDGLSGMTGAGRTLRPTLHSGSVLENVSPYRVGAHQHVPEIAQLLGFPVSFTPHLLPVRRGLLATCNVRSTGPDLRVLLEAAYAGSAGRQGASGRDDAGARARPAHGPGRDRRLQRPVHRPDGRDLRRGQPREGSRRSGDPERQPRSRARGNRRPPPRRGGGLGVSVTAAEGFVASGVAAGIRPSGKPDVAVVRSVPRSVGAAMWTTNRVQAAPVTVSKRHLGLAQPQAVLINAGVANAATGAQGEADAVASAEGLARQLGLDAEEVIVLSTGVIGAPLPVEKVLAGARAASVELSPEGGAAAAAAILTTDSGPKVSLVQSGGFTVGGMAKGAGMIHPCLATMLVVVTTDYPLDVGESEAFLRPAVERSFNRISVDGDCSTNDAVILLANGASGAARDDAAFAEALDEVCSDLARQVVADGEGATVVLEIGVTGGATTGRGRGDRASDRDVSAREDGGVRPRPELGPGVDGGGIGPVRRRLRPPRDGPAHRPLRRRGRIRRGIADRRRTGALGRGLPDRSAARAR